MPEWNRVFSSSSLFAFINRILESEASDIKLLIVLKTQEPLKSILRRAVLFATVARLAVRVACVAECYADNVFTQIVNINH